MRKLILLLVGSFLFFSFSLSDQECTDLSVSEHWRGDRAALCKNDPHCSYCPLKYSPCIARYTSKATNIEMTCNVCFDTAQIQNQQTKGLAKLKSCINMNARSTKIVAMKKTEWSKCKSADTNQKDFPTIWQNLLKEHNIANIMVGKHHIIYKIRYRFFGQSCQKSFKDCGKASRIKEDNVNVKHLAALSDCMKCSCPWGTQNTTENTYTGRRGETEDNPVVTDTPEESTISEKANEDSTLNPLVGGIVGGCALLFLLVLAVMSYFLWKKKKKEKEEQENQVDLNPVYGDYSDPDYVVEVVDQNVDYAGPEEEEEDERTMARDNNSQYGDCD